MNTDKLRGLPVITLIQPWASWVAMGWKTAETRTSTRLLKQLEGKYFLVHAGKAWDLDAIDAARPYLSQEQLDQTIGAIFEVRGCILAMALGGKMRPMAKEDEPLALIGSTWIAPHWLGNLDVPLPRWILPLERIEPLDKPIPARGQQGIWYIQ